MQSKIVDNQGLEIPLSGFYLTLLPYYRNKADNTKGWVAKLNKVHKPKSHQAKCAINSVQNRSILKASHQNSPHESIIRKET